MRKEELNTLQTNKSNTIQDHVGAGPVSAQNRGITLIAFAISRKCVRYEERAWKPCERREKERKV